MISRLLPSPPRLALLLSAAAVQASSAAAATPEQVHFFEEKIRPVLAEHCYSCHGPDKQNNGLRLDSRAALAKGGDYGPVIDSSAPQTSKLLKAIRHEAGVEAMPKKGPKLGDAEIAALTEWVAQGMPWPEEASPSAAAPAEAWRSHWAFQPVKMPAVPALKDASAVSQPLDAFVLARLEKEGLSLSPTASRETLIRRAYLMLLGFPPTYEQVKTFVSDPAPDAWPRLVDSLLASPHYGERMARRWMDVARYADTKGYVFQEERRYAYAYTYRDWLIQAFNADMPYDRFLVNQIAADQSEEAKKDPRDLAAMGFLTLGRRFLNATPDIIDDRIDTVFRGTQGLTVTCARCHDHKFDPIPTQDYYSLYGVFNSSREPAEKPQIGDPPAGPERDAYEKELAVRQGKIDEFRNGIAAAIFRQEEIARYLDALPGAAGKDERQTREYAREKNLLPAAFLCWQKRFETRPDGHPVAGLWKKLAALPADAPFKERAAAILAESESTVNPGLVRLFEEAPPANLTESAALYAKGFAAAKAGDAAFAGMLTWLDAQDGLAGIPKDELLRGMNRGDREKENGLRAAAEEWKATSPGAPPRAMVMVDVDTPGDSPIFIRGNAGRHGPPAPRQFLQAISPPDRKPFTKGSGRMEMAERIASPTNPLTARVFVNRVWSWLFGGYLVDTPGDFGVRTAAPDNPELLDALASQLMEDGWSIKRLQRSILLSRAWQQSSTVAGPTLAKDPQNRLFGRQNRVRLDFEALRDSLLKASGKLELTSVGGRSVDILAEPFTGKRTLYGFVDRQNLPALFRTFDFASPDTTAPKRFETTVPQQALFMMNSPFVQAQTKELIRQLDTLPDKGTEPRVRHLFEQILSRDPEPEELALMRQAVEELTLEPRQTGSRWQNGFGQYDDAAKKVKFTPLPWFGEARWSGGPVLPDPVTGWASLGADHGHPGNDHAHAAIRRWNAPEATTVSLSGKISRPSEAGDGVKALIVSNRHGVLGTWDIGPKGEVKTSVASVTVESGDTIDFVLDCGGDSNSDSFHWAPRVTDTRTGVVLADAREDFGGPGMSAWEACAQTLLCSNEFLFTD